MILACPQCNSPREKERYESAGEFIKIITVTYECESKLILTKEKNNYKPNWIFKCKIKQ